MNTVFLIHQPLICALMRQEVYALIHHSSDISFADMIQWINQASKECDFMRQSGTQILNGMMIAACTNVEVNKWISEYIIEINNMTSTDNFKQTARASHNVML